MTRAQITTIGRLSAILDVANEHETENRINGSRFDMADPLTEFDAEYSKKLHFKLQDAERSYNAANPDARVRITRDDYGRYVLFNG